MQQRGQEVYTATAPETAPAPAPAVSSPAGAGPAPNPAECITARGNLQLSLRDEETTRQQLGTTLASLARERTSLRYRNNLIAKEQKEREKRPIEEKLETARAIAARAGNTAEALQNANAQISSLEAQLATLNSEIESLSSEIQAVQSRISTLRSQRHSQISAHNAAKRKAEEATRAAEELCET